MSRRLSALLIFFVLTGCDFFDLSTGPNAAPPPPPPTQASPEDEPAPDVLTGKVVRVIDGDTLSLVSARKSKHHGIYRENFKKAP
jgi:endonuclease YncB( thermonuclease family)